MKVDRDQYKAWLQDTRPNQVWNEDWFNNLYTIIERFGFNAISYDLIPIRMDGEQFYLEKYIPAKIRNPNTSVFSEQKSFNEYLNGAYIGPKPFKWEDYTGEYDVPQTLPINDNERTIKQIHQKQQTIRVAQPYTKIPQIKYPSYLTPEQKQSIKDAQELKKFEERMEFKKWKNDRIKNIQQILRNKKQDEIINEFYQIGEQFITKFKKQLVFVAIRCQCKKLSLKLRIISSLNIRKLYLMNKDDIKSFQLHIQALEQQFFNYKNKDIRRLYLAFMLEKSLYQILIKFGNLQQEIQELHLKLQEDPQNDPYNNEAGIYDHNFVSKKIQKEQLLGRCAVILDKLRRYISTNRDIFNQLWDLMNHNWVLDKFYDYDVKQHIKNVSSNLYIPKKNRVMVQNKTYNHCEQLTIAFYNINYKQHVHSKNISKKLLQKKWATIQKLWTVAKNCTMICLQEIQAGIKIPSFSSYYLEYNHDDMLKMLKKLNLPEIDKDESRSGGLATFIKTEITHATLNMNSGIFDDINHKIHFTQVFKIPSGQSWVFVLNCYVFPDPYRKKVVIQEIEYIIYTLKKKYNPCNIIGVGDLNYNIRKINPEDLPLYCGLNIVHPRTPTHKSGSTIDFAFVSCNIDTDTKVFDVHTDHHITVLNTIINTQTVVRWQAITNNKKVNQALNIQWQIIDIIDTNCYIQLSQDIKQQLQRKVQIRKITNPFIDFLQSVKEEDLAEIYCENFSSKVFLLKYIQNPKKYYSLVKRYFKLNKTSPVVKQVIHEGTALSEQDTDLLLLKEYKNLYSMNQNKIIQDCEPARILITPVDMIKIRKKLGPDKAIGDNLIPHSLPHFNCNILYFTISIMNLVTKCFPSQFFFQSRMMFFNKDKNVEIPDLGNIRPITVTTPHQKTIEHYFKDKIGFANEEMAYGQLGFVKKQETYMHVLKLLARLNIIREDRKQYYEHMQIPIQQRINQSVKLLFVDIWKAFDSVPHDNFFIKLKKTLNNDELYNMIVWYFNQLGVNIGMNRIPVNRGTPQGSVVSPLFWLIFFDELLIILQELLGKQNVLCYADDLLLICLTTDLMIQAKKIIDKWAIDNKIKINYKFNKTAFVEIYDKPKRGRDKKQILNTDIYGELKSQKTYKYLGVEISQNLVFPLTKIKQCMEIARLLRFQNMSIKRKIGLFQAFLLGKFRHTLIAIKLYHQQDLQLRIENKILQLLRITLNLLKTCPKVKLMQQNLIKNSVAGIISYADKRVLTKLQAWEDRHDKYKPFNWMQFDEWFQYTDPDPTWECNINNDGFWLRLLVDNKHYFKTSWCSLCEQIVGDNQHINTCKGCIQQILQGIQTDLLKFLNYDLMIREISTLIFQPDLFYKISNGKKQRIMIKEIFAYHLQFMDKIWKPDMNQQYIKKVKKGKKNQKNITKEQKKKNRFPEKTYDDIIAQDVEAADYVDVSFLFSDV